MNHRTVESMGGDTFATSPRGHFPQTPTQSHSRRSSSVGLRTIPTLDDPSAPLTLTPNMGTINTSTLPLPENMQSVSTVRLAPHTKGFPGREPLSKRLRK